MSPTSPRSPDIQRKTPSVRPLILLLLLVHLSQVLYSIPLNRVLELRLCEEHFAQHELTGRNNDGSIPEKLCKIDEVQKKIAWLQGIMETTLVVCDFIVTIPFSYVARKFGVQTVLWCNLTPRICLSVWALVVGNYQHLIPTKAITLGPFLNVLGGECVFQSTVFTLTSAIAQEYVERASYFSYISSTTYIISFVGPTLAAFTMSRNLWLPFWASIGLLLCAFPAVKLLPRAEITAPPSTTIEIEGTVSVEEAGPLLANQEVGRGTYANAFDTNLGTGHSLTDAVRKPMRLIIGRRNFQVLLCSFVLTAFASSDTKLLVQYISKRYEWTFAQAGYMLSAKAIVNFFLLANIVPRVIRTSMSTKVVHGSEVRLNYLGAEASIIISVVGVLCVALSFQFWMLLAALMIYALGSALPVFTMSLVKSSLIALPNSDDQDFSIVMLTKTLGSLVGAPVMAILWVQAIKLGGLGLGLPYFVSACIYLMAAFVVARLSF